MPSLIRRHWRLALAALAAVAVIAAVEIALVLLTGIAFVVTVGLRIAALAVVGLIVLSYVRFGGTPGPSPPGHQGGSTASETTMPASAHPAPSEPRSSTHPGPPTPG